MAKCYKCGKNMRNTGHWYCAAYRKKAGTYKRGETKKRKNRNVRITGIFR